MGSKSEYLTGLFQNAETLGLSPGYLADEERYLREFDRYEQIGVVKYMKPEFQQQLKDQRIQVRLARQFLRARLS